jgi:hypothetical protein
VHWSVKIKGCSPSFLIAALKTIVDIWKRNRQIAPAVSRFTLAGSQFTRTGSWFAHDFFVKLLCKCFSKFIYLTISFSLQPKTCTNPALTTNSVSVEIRSHFVRNCHPNKPSVLVGKATLLRNPMIFMLTSDMSVE